MFDSVRIKYKFITDTIDEIEESYKNGTLVEGYDSREGSDYDLAVFKRSKDYFDKYYKIGKTKKKIKPLQPSEPSDKSLFSFITFDIETENWKDFLCLGYHDIENDFYGYSENLEESINDIFKYCKENKISNAFAHNGGKFDFMFILEAIFRKLNKNKYVIKSAIPRGSGFLKIEIYSREFKKKITFRDSLCFIPASLRKAGEAYKVETLKGDVDYLYLGQAFRNENYIKKIIEDTEDDANGNSTFRNRIIFNNIVVKDYNHLLKLNRGVEPKIEKIKYSLNIDLLNFEKEKHEINSSDMTEDAKKVKIEKLKNSITVHRIYNKDDIKLYLKNDCVCLSQIIRNHFESPIIKDAGISFTSAGQAIKIFQRYLKFTINPSTDEEDRFVRKGYLGGRTEVFKHYHNSDYDIKENEANFKKETLKTIKSQQGKPIYCYDANSLYPTVMRDNLYPLKYEGIKNGKNNYEKYEFGVWNVKVKVPDLLIPPLGVQHTFKEGSAKFIFPTGEFEGYWTKQELEYAVTLGCEIIEYNNGACYSNGEYIFKDFINTMYNARLKARKEGDSTTAEICKLAMNSCYGKLGQSPEEKKVLVPFENIIGQDPITVRTEDGEVAVLSKMVSNSEGIFSKVILACYVTSYARILMHKKIMEIGPENVYYMDTDSLFTTVMMKTGDELGEFKKEYEYKSACFLLPKTYTVFDGYDRLDRSKKVIKGFDKKMIQGLLIKDIVDYFKLDIAELKTLNKEKFMSHGEAFNKGTILGVSRQQAFEEKNLKLRLALLNRELESVLKIGNKKKATSLKGKIKNLQSNLDKIDETKYKSVRKRYDKRLGCEDLIHTIPINLGGSF